MYRDDCKIMIKEGTRVRSTSEKRIYQEMNFPYRAYNFFNILFRVINFISASRMKNSWLHNLLRRLSRPFTRTMFNSFFDPEKYERKSGRKKLFVWGWDVEPWAELDPQEEKDSFRVTGSKRWFGNLNTYKFYTVRAFRSKQNKDNRISPEIRYDPLRVPRTWTISTLFQSSTLSYTSQNFFLTFKEFLSLRR